MRDYRVGEPSEYHRDIGIDKERHEVIEDMCSEKGPEKRRQHIAVNCLLSKSVTHLPHHPFGLIRLRGGFLLRAVEFQENTHRV